jgi:hypothetical protein
MTIITCTLDENICVNIFVPCPVILGMRNLSNKSCREHHNTHFIFKTFFFENRAVYEIMWKNIAETGRPQVTIWHMLIACWIPKVTNTQSENVILIDSLLQQS